MSDIIYTPPASSGGTTINPTNNFIPVRQNATTFVDSILQCVPNSFVQSVRSGVGLGISTSFTLTTAETYIGDFNNLIDSKFIKVQNDTVTSRIYSSNSGFYLDFNGKTYRFGDYNNVNNGVFLNVDDQNRQVAFTDNNTIDGLYLNYALNTYQLGKITAGSTFSIDAANQYAQITLASIQYMVLDQLNGLYSFGDYSNGQGLQWDNGNNEFVLKQQGFEYIYLGGQTNFFGDRASILSYKIDYNTSILSIGDNAYTQNETLFVVDLSQEIICTQTLSNRKGLLIDFSYAYYKFGDFNGVDKNTYIFIDDGNQATYFRTNSLHFTGTPLESGSSGGSSGKHLVINLNGNQYKIDLKNP